MNKNSGKSGLTNNQIWESIKLQQSEVPKMPEVKSNTTITGITSDHPEFGPIVGVRIEHKLNDSWTIHGQQTHTVLPQENGHHVNTTQAGFQFRFF